MSIDSLSESFGRKKRFLIWVFRKRWRNQRNWNLNRLEKCGLEIPGGYGIITEDTGEGNRIGKNEKEETEKENRKRKTKKGKPKKTKKKKQRKKKQRKMEKIICVKAQIVIQ